MKFIRLFGLLALGVSASAQSPETLTLSQAVRIALDGHPAIRAAESGRRIAETSLSESTSSRWPTASLTETITRGNNPVYAFGSLLEQARFGPENFSLQALNAPDSVSNFRTQMDVRLPLFDRRQTSSRIERARVGVEQSEFQSQSVEQRVRYELIRSYFGLIVAKARSELARYSVQMADEDVKRASDMREAGMTVDADLLSARVQRAEFRQQQIQAEANVVSAIAALNIAMGQPVDIPRMVDATMQDKTFELLPQAELIRLALENRPDYLSVRAGIRSAEQGTRAAQGDILPEVAVFANYGTSGRYLGSGSADYTAGASIKLNLFNPGRNARVEQARAMEESAAAAAEEMANQIRLQVVQAHQNHVASEERLAVAKLSVEQSEEAHRIVQERYGAGLTTITEVLRAETALVQSRTNLITAQYEQRLGYATVLFATGTLNDERALSEGGAN